MRTSRQGARATYVQTGLGNQEVATRMKEARSADRLRRGRKLRMRSVVTGSSCIKDAQRKEEKIQTDDEIPLDRIPTTTPPILLPFHRLRDFVQLVFKPESSELGTTGYALDPVLTEEFGGVDAAIGCTRQACHAVRDSAPTDRGSLTYQSDEGFVTVDFRSAMADFPRALTLRTRKQ